MERENNRLKVHSVELAAWIKQPALPWAAAAPRGPARDPSPAGGGGGCVEKGRAVPGRDGSDRTSARRGAQVAARAPAFVSPGTGCQHRLRLGETPAAVGLERMR